MTQRSWASHAVSLTASHKTANEDTTVTLDQAGIWAVCDGVGGHGHGDYASAQVAEAVGGLDGHQDASHLLQELVDRLEATHQALVASESNSASTVAALMIRGDKCAVVWAGDSRIYRHRSGTLDQLTHDHSVVQQLVDDGQISAAEARVHQLRNVITAAVGAGEGLELEVRQFDVEQEDIFVICSDGFLAVLSEDRLVDVLKTGRTAAGEALGALLSSANRDDDSTFILVAAS